MELASSDAAAVLFFLYKEKEKNGGAKSGRPMVAPTVEFVIYYYWLQNNIFQNQ